MRFRKGTTDHDSDGRMGGSMKGKRMMAKATTKAPAKRSPRKAKVNDQDAALKVEAISMATVPDPQSGGASIIGDTVPSVAQVKAAKKEALEQQFGVADAKGSPDTDEIAEASLSRAMRGY